MIQAYFSNIKNELIEKINATNKEIIVAVAWFTQKELFTAIMTSLERGVEVSIILINDIINRSEYGLDFSLFIERGGKLCFVNSRKSLMHNKFCLFDNSILITGSYNWTYSAEQKNAENIIVTDDIEVCNAYNNHFIELWNDLEEVLDYAHINVCDAEITDFLYKYDDMLEEYQSMTAKNINTSDALTAIKEIKNNIAVMKLATLKTRKGRQNPTLKLNIGMRCMINNIKNRTLNIIKQGQTLPYTNTVDTQTASENQGSAMCEILLGNNNKADENTALLKITLNDLPKLKAGEVKFKTKVTIDTNGYMHVEYVCINTGIAKDAVYISPNIINY